MDSDFSRTAHKLIEVLTEIKRTGYGDASLIQEALTLNARLAPVYMALYGGVPLISTEYPSHVWWPRAMNKAKQALAAVEGGLLDHTGTRVEQTPSPVDARVVLVRMGGLRPLLDRHLENPRATYFDPGRVLDMFERGRRDIARLADLRPDVLDDFPVRSMPTPSGTTEYEGRGYVLRHELEQLRDDIDYCVQTVGELIGPYSEPDAVQMNREGIFVAGTQFDAMSMIHDLISGAATSITIVDGYIDDSVLAVLSAKAAGVKVRILTARVPENLRVLANTFNAQHGGLEIRTSNDFHDRFLVIDEDDRYHLGASIKDAGRRAFMFSKIEEQVVLAAFESEFRSVWANAVVAVATD